MSSHSVTKFPHLVSHVSHTSAYTTWSNFSNIHQEEDYSSTRKISGKSGSNPKVCPIFIRDFRFDIPEGAKVTSIQVSYSHRRYYSVSGKYPSIGAPTLDLMNAGDSPAIVSKTGTGPSTSFVERSKTWTGEVDATVVGNVDTSFIKTTYDLPSREIINDENFGVKISYPSNTSANEGYVHLKYVKITVNYELPEYELQIRKTNQGTVYKDVPQNIQIVANNLKRMDYQPTLTITLPSNVSVSNISSTWQNFGQITVNGNIITWVVPFEKNIGSFNLSFNIIFNEEGENQIINVVEQLTNASSTLSIDVYPYTLDITEIEGEKTIYAKQNIDFVIPIEIPTSLLDQVSTVYLIPNQNMSFKNGNSYASVNANGNYAIPISNFNENGYYELTAKTSVLGVTSIGLSTSTAAETINFVVKCISSGLTYPIFTIIELSEEECARLGDGYAYTINSALKINCASEHITNFVDYYRNFRIGVVNNIESTNDRISIFEACNNFSNAISVLNHYESKTLEFVYNEDYPVYILILGNYPVNDYFTLEFTHPCLIESVKFEGYDTATVFPVPIENINDDYSLMSPSEITLDMFEKSNSITLYDFPLEFSFGTNNKQAVRGIQLILDLSVESPIALIARLKSNKGVGERSIIVYPEDSQVIIGGEFDLWGFSIVDMVDLSSWEFELEINNILNPAQNVIEIENIQVTASFLTLKQNKVNMIVEGENMRYYGLFVRKINMNPGLKTKTKYIEVDGSDIHKPASMNIDKKEIEVEFRVVGCTIEETTALLREIAKKLTNNRDKLNQPIPKRVEFDHIPGFHFDYILENTIDEDPKTIGYESKLKLTIYDGTSWANQDTITNTVGSNLGICKVSPVIQFIPLSTTVEIIESVHNQKLSISNSQFTVNSIVELRCADQKAYMRTNESDELIDITDSIDWDVDWFVLYPGEYSFETNGTCIIQNVIHTERGA